MSEQNRGAAGALTRREQQIVGLVCEGRINKDIGSALGISESTVKRHLNHIYRKFGGRKRAELIRMYTRPVGASES
jgi:DNA-binding CsgD family transcriptional regulator